MNPALKDGFLDIDGACLEARWIGAPPADAACLVFLHEGLGSVGLWRDFPDRLAGTTGLSALVYSRRGYGRSDPMPLPRPLSFHRDEGLDVLPKVIAAAGIKKVIVVGHSDGASMAIAYAGGAADAKLSGLIVMAPHLFNEEINIQAIRQATDNFHTGDLRAKLARHHGDNVDCAFLGWSGAWLDPDFRHFNMEEYLPRIRVPTLVIQGDQDEYATSRQYEVMGEKMKAPCRILALPNCRHSPHRDQPEQTLAAISDFIAGLQAAK